MFFADELSSDLQSSSDGAILRYVDGSVIDAVDDQNIGGEWRGTQNHPRPWDPLAGNEWRYCYGKILRWELENLQWENGSTLTT